MSEIEIKFVLLHELAEPPRYAHPGDAGADLSCVEGVTLAPGERALVPTGLAIALPEGYVGLVHPRSGLAFNHGIGIVNTPGTIDSGYRGNLIGAFDILDFNQKTTIKKYDRLVQICAPGLLPILVEIVDSLDKLGEKTSRGSGGFGSTGV